MLNIVTTPQYKRPVILIAFMFISITANAQWNQSPFVPPVNLYEVEYPALNSAYIAAYQHLYKSTDGGISWSQIYSAGPFANFSDLVFVNADTGFVSLYGSVMRTFDGGMTWSAISGNGQQPVKITGEKLFASYVSNDTTYLVRSDDFGDAWSVVLQQSEVNALPYLFSFIDDLNGYFINPNKLNEVYKTIDAGVSWDTLIITNGPLVPQAKYDFKDLQNGYLYGSWGSQSDPTRTWNTGTFYFPIDLDGFGVLPVLDLDFNTSRLYAATLYGKIFYSINNGQDWTEQLTPTIYPVLSVSFFDNDHGIAITDQNVLYTSNGGFTGIMDAVDKSPYQVFPNPVVRELHVLNNSGKANEFTLYNSSGALLFKKDLSERSNSLDLSGFLQGYYFYTITDNHHKIFAGKFIKL